MLLSLRKQVKFLAALGTAVLLLNPASVHAAGPPVPSALDNPVVIGFVILAAILLLIIAILANLLTGVAQVKMEKDKKSSTATAAATAVAALFLLMANPVHAQGGDPAPAASTVAGISGTAFFLMASVIFVELLVILVLLVNVRILLRVEKEKLAVAGDAPVKKREYNWWMKLNSFRPVEQNADLDLGHDYDGIRELDNRLPPWWLYGFYLTIIVGCIYLWRYHVSHTAPLSAEEYATAVANADEQVKEYLKKKGESVDENTVTVIKDAGQLAAGKTIFLKSCVACHKEDARGDVGPNLTDDYWLHGGDIKSIFKTIRYGINAMPQWQNSYSNKEIAEVASYVKSLHGTNPANAKAPQGVLFKEEGPASDSTAAKDSTAPKAIAAQQ
jgi:cytochrome c oxidase cbb3-type subunit 3